jgi:hypothetical protein
MSAWDDSDLPSNASASKPPTQQGLSDTQLAELSESISSALKKFKDACAVVGTAKDSSKLRAGAHAEQQQRFCVLSLFFMTICDRSSRVKRPVQHP